MEFVWIYKPETQNERGFTMDDMRISSIRRMF